MKNENKTFLETRSKEKGNKKAIPQCVPGFSLEFPVFSRDQF